MLCFTSPTIKRLNSPVSSLETARIRHSWTRLLSWYSSIITSSNSFLHWIAASVGSFVSSSSRIFNAKCSKSSKSKIFFSRFFFSNASINSAVRRVSSPATGAICHIRSINASSSAKKNSVFIFFMADLIVSRCSFNNSNFSMLPSYPRFDGSLSKEKPAASADMLR